MRLKKLRIVEYIQRAELGGNPTRNSDNLFDHGEGVFVVSKRELIALFYEVLPFVKDDRLQNILNSVLAYDCFIARDGGSDGVDLPDV